MQLTVELADEAATTAFGERLAGAIRTPPLNVALRGALGSGKTALVRAVLRALGVDGPIRSPTYTLLEPYQTARIPVYHLDLYRLAEPDELEFIGARDLFGEAVLFIEWPERAVGWLPPADLDLCLREHGGGRVAALVAGTRAGDAVLQRLQASAA